MVINSSISIYQYIIKKIEIFNMLDSPLLTNSIINHSNQNHSLLKLTQTCPLNKLDIILN